MEQHQLDVVGLTSTHSVGSEAPGEELDSLRLWSCPEGEASGSCEDTHKPPAERLCVGVLSERVAFLQLQIAGGNPPIQSEQVQSTGPYWSP